MHAYAFAIDIVLLVLQDFYFATLILGYNRIIVEMCFQTKRKADLMPRNEKMAHPTDKFGPNPTMAAL